MKRFTTLFLVLGIVLLVLHSITLHVKMSDGYRQIVDAVAEMNCLGLDLSAGTVVRDEDSHGGFHGDGRTFTVLTFSEEDRETLEQDMEGAYWHELPMTENVARAARDLAEDENGESLFPEVERGYYYFRDRHSESLDRADDSELFYRGSWNFTMALYDSETGTLYYFELDT